MRAAEANRGRTAAKLALGLAATCAGAMLSSCALWFALDAAPSPAYVATAVFADLVIAAALGLLVLLSRSPLANGARPSPRPSTT